MIQTIRAVSPQQATYSSYFKSNQLAAPVRSASAHAVNEKRLARLMPMFSAGGVDRVTFGNTALNMEIPVFNLVALKAELLKVKDNEEKRYEVGKPLLDALEEYGTIRVDNHRVPQDIIDRLLAYIPKVLGKPLSELKKFVVHEISAIRGLQAYKEPKRVFTVGASDNVVLKGHEQLTDNGIALFNEFQNVSKDMLEILSIIYEGKPDGILPKFAFENTLNTPSPLLKDATLRQIYYPSQEELKRDGIKVRDTLQDNTVRLRPHLDYGLITVLPASKESGLYILPNRYGKGIESEDAVRQIPLKEWIKFNAKPGELLIQIGRQMALATKGMKHPLSATWHTVLASDEELQTGRSSSAFFVDADRGPLPDLAGTLNAGQHVTATYQFPGQPKFDVTSLYKLMVKKRLSENNKKALNEDGTPVSEEELIERYTNLAQSVQVVAQNNPNLTYQP